MLSAISRVGQDSRWLLHSHFQLAVTIQYRRLRSRRKRAGRTCKTNINAAQI
jgi:hypothetical protein